MPKRESRFYCSKCDRSFGRTPVEFVNNSDVQNWMKKNDDYYNSSDWRDRCRQVYDRAKKLRKCKCKVYCECYLLCECCQINVLTQVHHLSYKNFKNEKLEELVGLCDDCHNFTHEIIRRRYTTQKSEKLGREYYKELGVNYCPSDEERMRLFNWMQSKLNKNYHC